MPHIFVLDETAGYLAKLVRKETNNGHGIPAMAQNVSDEVESVSIFVLFFNRFQVQMLTAWALS